MIKNKKGLYEIIEYISTCVSISEYSITNFKF